MTRQGGDYNTINATIYDKVDSSMRQTTVCFLVKNKPERQVLLGFKKAGFGAGKNAGIGGKVESGETVETAAIREVEEEVGVKILAENLRFMGTVTFMFPSKPEWNQEVSIYVVEKWLGEPEESNEMRPAWFKLEEIPYGSMWQDARLWIPRVLDGYKIQARMVFREDNETVAEVSVDRE
jgi:8-oxo-dGTP pyrophosphatase MutT (NUDIX family)